METKLIREIAQINPHTTKKEVIDFINYLDTAGSFDGKIQEVQRLTSNYPSRAQRMVAKDDILISSVRPKNRHNCYVSMLIPNLMASSGYIQVRTTSPSIIPRWLYYRLTTKKMIQYYEAVANSSQTTFPTFNSSTISDLRVEIPSLQVQRHIVGVTSSPQ